MKRLCFGFSIALTLAGCDVFSTADPSDHAVYQLTFHEDHAEQYGGPTCPGSFNLYCRTMGPADRTFTGSLEIKNTIATLSLVASQPWTGDADGTEVSLHMTGQCGSIIIT